MAKVLGLNSERVEQNSSYSVLKQLIAGQKELGTALHTICEPIENKYKSNPKAEGFELDTLWSSIIYLAATTSFKDQSQQKLVDLVVQLQKRPDLEKDGEVCKMEDMVVWKDLPTFGYKIRDAWNFNPQTSSKDVDQETSNHWINLNAFVAALLANDPSDHLGLSLFGIWTTREALENTGKVPDAALAAAATWLVYAGPTLSKLSGQNKSFDGKLAKPGPAFQDNDWRGFSQARWGAWQAKLHDAQGEVADPTAVDLVQEAIQAMRECQ